METAKDLSTDAKNTLTGIALNITCFSAFAIIDLAVRQDGDVLCHESILFDPSGAVEAKAEVRSLRRSIKVGDLVTCEGKWQSSKEKRDKGPERRLRALSTPICLGMRHCDAAGVGQMKYELGLDEKKIPKVKQRPVKRRRDVSDGTEIGSSSGSSVTQESCGHSSKTNARDRCEIFVRFVLSNLSPAQLNLGSGIVDVAGGGGHVSLAFALAGVKSTVVDPRDSCGMLPKRDRKVYRRASKNSPLVLQFDTHRAWFGGRVSGADSAFSGGSDEPNSIPPCGTRSDEGASKMLMEGCSAVVAMHPDEATEAAVDWSVENGRPFFVVPCCVFARLFPHRVFEETGKQVQTQDEFVEYLMRKHPDAQMETLQFDGANKCVYFAGSNATALETTK